MCDSRIRNFTHDPDFEIVVKYDSKLWLERQLTAAV